MKRMSEVFELPCGGVDVQGADVYYSQADNEREIDDAIAHAINHVDALADTLAELLECAAENNLEGLAAWDDAYSALATYRGEE